MASLGVDAVARRPQCLCAHLRRIDAGAGAARPGDVSSRDSAPEQANWLCAHGIYDRAWQAGSRPRPSICFGPRPGNCPEFEPGTEAVHRGVASTAGPPSEEVGE